jgi:hypothetical protein
VKGREWVRREFAIEPGPRDPRRVPASAPVLGEPELDVPASAASPNAILGGDGDPIGATRIDGDGRLIDAHAGAWRREGDQDV